MAQIRFVSYHPGGFSQKACRAFLDQCGLPAWFRDVRGVFGQGSNSEQVPSDLVSEILRADSSRRGDSERLEAHCFA